MVIDMKIEGSKTILSIMIVVLLLTATFSAISGKKANQDEVLNEVTIPGPIGYNLNNEDMKLLGKQEYVPGELIVKFNESLTINKQISTVQIVIDNETVAKEIVTFGIDSLDVLNMEYCVIFAEKLIEDDSIPSLSEVYRFVFDKNIDIRSVVYEYMNDSSVEFAEPNYIYHPDVIPNDPYFNQQWALHNTGQTGGTPDADIDASDAWDTTMGDDEVVIAILDSGVDYTHPDLGGCTVGVTEVNCPLEFDHPLDGHDWITIDFDEVFSDYDFDSISLHFSTVDIGEDGTLIVQTDSAQFSKCKILFSHYIGTSVNDIWTPYTEMGANTVEIVYSCDDAWGFEIDKVRLHKWGSLSNRCPDKYVNGYDFVCNDPDPMDDFGHGTHCAGIVTAITDNGIGVAGVAGNCKIMPIRVLSKNGGTLFSISRGIAFAARNYADIISMSLGGFESKIMNIVIDYAYYKGAAIISSAGNDNISTGVVAYPAHLDKVIGVTATDHKDSKASFSNYGFWTDVAAPGSDVLSLRAFATDMYLGSFGYSHGTYFVPPYNNDAILYRSWGTSMSCPHVAGVAALALSQNPELTQRELRTVLRSSTDPVISDKYIGAGRINAYKAVQKAAPVIVEFDDILDSNYVTGQVEIKGTAKGDQFQNYMIQHSTELYPNETSWVNIGGSTTPKDNQILLTWDTTGVDDGFYLLRVCMNAGGFEYEDRTFICVDNVQEIYYVDDDAEPSWYDNEKHFDKIQDAADVAGRSDTIIVKTGTYNEQVIIENRDVTIKGEAKTTTIIHNTEREYGTIEIFSGSIHLSDVTVKSWSPQGHNWFYFSIDGIEVYDSSISNVIFKDSSGVVLIEAFNNIISGSTFNGGAGIEIFGLLNAWYKNEISGNTITNGYVKVIDMDLITIKDNTISDVSTGIHIENSRFVDVYDNIISDCGTGIKIHGGLLNSIHENAISENTYGIEISNEFMPNKWNVVSENMIIHNEYGIILPNIDIFNFNMKNKHNTISQNTISDNQECGIKIVATETSDNYIYENNFINNGQNAYDNGGNIWHLPIFNVGNYWDDYEEKYPNANKVVRTLLPNYWSIPYDIPGGDNQDLYPLIEQYTVSQNQPGSQPSTPSNPKNN